MVTYAFLTAVSFLILIWKLPRHWRDELLARGWLMDIIISLGVLVIFAGTFSGMMVGVIAGLVVSAALPLLAWAARVKHQAGVKARQAPTTKPQPLSPTQPIPLLWRLEEALPGVAVRLVRIITIILMVITLLMGALVVVDVMLDYRG